MEKGEILDEMFDLKPIFPDTYSIKPQISNKEMRKSSPPKMKSSPVTSSSWNRNRNRNRNRNNNNPAKFISFENSNSNSNSNTNTDDTAAADLDTATAADIINFSSRSSGAIDNIHDSMNQQKRQYPSSTARTPSQALDHVMAERKRRQNLSQLFISLSKAVPGLKKLDKASLLEDGISYLKTLQERVGVLEKEAEEMRRSSMATEDSNSNSSSEIQARISDDKRHVLIKILQYCNKDKEMGLMSRINPSEIMEKMHLDVVDMRIMPFGAALHITILAQMQGEFEVSVEDIVDRLHTLFRVYR